MPASKPEHPAVRAAREIDGAMFITSAGETTEEIVAKLVAVIHRAYAERDARVLKALEACAKVMQATITRDAYLDAGFEFPGYGGQTFFEIAKQAEAAIAEMKGE